MQDILSGLRVKRIIKILVVVAAGLSISAGSILSQETKPKPKPLKRRVLILDFTNAGKVKGGEAMDLTISDALIEHLQKTDEFIILRRDLAQAKAKKMMNNLEKYTVENAIRVGDSANADVVVMGTYAIYDDYIQIQAKAVDVHSGDVPVILSAHGQRDRNLFVTIQRLTRQMASRMSENLGPMDAGEMPAKRAMYEQALALNEKKQNRMLPSVSVGYMGVVGLTDSARILDFGSGIRIGWMPTPLFNGILNMYFEWNVWWSRDKYQNIPLFFNGLFMGVTYPVAVYKNVVAAPYFLAGNYGGHVGDYSIFSIAAFKMGLNVKYTFQDELAANVTTNLVTIMDNGAQMFLEFSGGIAKKF